MDLSLLFLTREVVKCDLMCPWIYNSINSCEIHYFLTSFLFLYDVLGRIVYLVSLINCMVV